MSRSKLLLTRRFPEAVMERAIRDYVVTGGQDRPLSPPELIEAAKGQDAIMTAPGVGIAAETFERLPQSVRIVATFSVGYDHLGLAGALRRGIAVTNTPDVLTDATADIALLCLLGAARRAQEGEAMLRSGHWTGWVPTQLMGWHLDGKRLGIFGMGRIGRALAKRARAFGLSIHYFNRSRLPAQQEEGAIFHAKVDDLLRHSDFLSLNAPASAETENFLNAQRIALLPKGAIVVNTARGTLVDDEAMIAALRSGQIAAVGLDVFKDEPRFHSGYLEIPTAFLLPHMGSATTETRNAMGFCCLNNLDAFFAGKEPPNRIA